MKSDPRLKIKPLRLATFDPQAVLDEQMIVLEGAVRNPAYCKARSTAPELFMIAANNLSNEARAITEMENKRTARMEDLGMLNECAVVFGVPFEDFKDSRIFFKILGIKKSLRWY